MLSRREFLGTTVAVSTGALAPLSAGTVACVANATSAAVYLGKPLEHWLACVDESHYFGTVVSQAISAFARDHAGEFLARLRQQARDDQFYVLAQLVNGTGTWSPFIPNKTDVSAPIIDEFLRLLRTSRYFSDDRAPNWRSQEPKIFEFCARVVVESKCRKTQAVAMRRLARYEAATFAGRTDLATAVARYVEIGVAEILEEGPRDHLPRLSAAAELIADLDCPVAQKLRLCSLLLEVPDSSARLHGRVVSQFGKLGLLGVPNLIAQVTGRTIEIEELATSLLAEMGAAVVPQMLTLAASDDPKQREAAFRVLTTLEDIPQGVIARFQSGLDDPNPAVRTLAAVGLAPPTT
jgi:hypothetical protein